VSIPFKVIIPVRYASTRLPGKPLQMIGEKTLIDHVYQNAIASSAENVIIATDDDRIEDVARSIGATVIMTSTEHKSGTDRIHEALTKMNEPDETIIVNLQGDEFGLTSKLINQVADTLHKSSEAEMATLCEEITDKSAFHDKNVVKVVRDCNNNALYFSRSAIPWVNENNSSTDPRYVEQPFKHVGIYAYRMKFLKKFATLPPCNIEISESLEQLRALYHGHKIQVEVACEKHGVEINTKEDLEKARKAVI